MNMCTFCNHKAAVEWGEGWTVKRFYCDIKKQWIVPRDNCSRFKEKKDKSGDEDGD